MPDVVAVLEVGPWTLVALGAVVLLAALGAIVLVGAVRRSAAQACVDAALRAAVERLKAGDAAAEPEVRERLAKTEDAAAARRVARLAGKAGRDALALAALRRYVALRPGDLGRAATLAARLLDAGERAEAAGAAARALERFDEETIRAPEGDPRGRERVETLYGRLVEVYEKAAGKAWEEDTIADLVAAGAFSGSPWRVRAIGHRIIERSTRPPRRLEVPPQADLRAAAERALAEAPGRPEGHEDLGLYRLREGDWDGAARAFREAIRRGPDAWPAYLGLAAALEAADDIPRLRHRRALWSGPEVPGLREIVSAWDGLTDLERRLVRLSVAPLAWAIPRILEAGGRVHILALDARITDLPRLADARGRFVRRDGRAYDALGGVADGAHSVTRIDELYEGGADGGWTLAHEFAHAAYEVADAAILKACRRHYARFRQTRKDDVDVEYGLRNEYELFACGYVRHLVRAVLPPPSPDEEHEADRALGLDAWFREIAPMPPALP